MSIRALAIARPGKEGERHLDVHTDIWCNWRVLVLSGPAATFKKSLRRLVLFTYVLAYY